MGTKNTAKLPNTLITQCVVSTWGIYLGIEPFEWVIILLLITIGLTVETINTALEMTLDCISLERRDDIKHAKDAAAGAMLIFSIGAFICACYIFLPYILDIV